MQTEKKYSPEKEFIFTLWKYKWRILLPTLLFTIIVAIGSGPGFIPPLYQAEIIMYPPSAATSKGFIQFEPRFGRNVEVEEHMQILRSNFLRDSLVNKYNLAAHYGFEEINNSNIQKLHKSLTRKIQLSRTRYSAVSIKVKDKDPQMAAAIANDMVVIGDRIKAYIINENLSTALVNLEGEYAEKATQLKTLEDSLQQLLLKIPAGNKAIHLPFENLKKEYMSKLDYLNQLKIKRDEIHNNIIDKSPKSYIINPAEPNYKAVFPNRILWAITAFFASFLICIGLALFVDAIINFRNQLKSNSK